MALAPSNQFPLRCGQPKRTAQSTAEIMFLHVCQILPVGHGCVLRPWLFCAALDLARSERKFCKSTPWNGCWKRCASFAGFAFCRWHPRIAEYWQEVPNLLDRLMRHLAAAGLVLIKVLGHTESHKRLGCMLCTCPGEDFHVDYRLQQAPKAFQKHRWMSQCKDCSIKHPLHYLEASICWTACSLQSTNHYTENILKSKTFNFANCSAHCGTSTRQELLGAMALYFAWLESTGALVPCQWKSKNCMIQYWNFASDVANLPTERSVGEHLLGNRFQHILPLVAHNKFGTLRWKCSAGTKLSTVRKLLWETRSVGMLSLTSVPCKCCFHVFWESAGCTIANVYLHSFFRLRPYIGLA